MSAETAELYTLEEVDHLMLYALPAVERTIRTSSEEPK